MAKRSGGRACAVLPLVAVAVLVATACAVVAGCSSGIPPVAPTASPTATAGLRLEYRVLPLEGVAPGPDDLALVADVLRARLDATGVASSSVAPSGEDGVVVDVAVDPADVAVASELRALLGATGRLDFVPLGATAAAEGEVIDMERYPPLFSGDQVTNAAVGGDQTGMPTVDFVLGPNGASLFADYTAAHIGEYFAITLDGTAISVPVILSAIPDGAVQITMGGVGNPASAAQRLVTILRTGALPFPVEEVPADSP